MLAQNATLFIHLSTSHTVHYLNTMDLPISTFTFHAMHLQTGNSISYRRENCLSTIWNSATSFRLTAAGRCIAWASRSSSAIQPTLELQVIGLQRRLSGGRRKKRLDFCYSRCSATGVIMCQVGHISGQAKWQKATKGHSGHYWRHLLVRKSVMCHNHNRITFIMHLSNPIRVHNMQPPKWWGARISN